VIGGCLCGGVRVALGPPLRNVVICHCSLCRRSGTLAGASTSVPRDALRITSETTLVWYTDVNGRRRGFCSTCGATLFWAADDRDTISVSAGALDGPTGLVTEAHVYVSDAADWEAGATI
jgi:hypothetical protein